MTIQIAGRRKGAVAAAFTTMAAAALFLAGTAANAASSPTVRLGTTAQYAVLGASTVTNTNATTLNGSLGLSPGTSITGFPPGTVIPPATTNQTNAAAAKAQDDLTAAYVNAQGRPIDATTTADLANLHLHAGVYAGPSHGALQLTGPLVLDGAGDLSSVFIFQTNSSLTTAPASTVSLINGALACNVFWQVGSSATLGTGSVFTGNIMALASITVTHGVTVHGRALARSGAVTLDNDSFTKPSCATPPTTTTTTTTTTPGATTPTTVTPPGTPTKTPVGGTATPGASSGSGHSGAPPVAGPPRTDATPLSTPFPTLAILFVSLFAGIGTATAVLTRRRLHGRANR